MNKLIFIIMLVVFAGCAQEVPTSKVKISLALMLGSANFPGGLLLSGKNAKGKSFAKKIGATDSIELELPNGIWTFVAMGWKNTANFLEGDLHCGFKGNQVLSGTDINLVFDTSMSRCSSMPLFGEKFNGDIAFNLELNTCLNIKSHIQEEGALAAPTSLICGDPGEDTLGGGAQSAQVLIQTKDIDGKLGGTLVSSCQIFSGTYGTQAATNIKLPYLPEMVGIEYIVKTYDDVACSAGMKQYTFGKGFQHPAADFIGSVTPKDASNQLRVFLHADACNAAQISASPMAAGTTGGPYLVCTKAQFESIGIGGAGTPEASATYIIGKDIDFQNSNTPIAQAFSGSIEGGGHLLSAGNQPLFMSIKIPTGGEEGRIHNLKISNFNISESFVIPVGILAGQITSNTADEGRIEIHDIKVENSSVTNTNTSNIEPVGGLIGKISLVAPTVDQEVYIRESLLNINVTNLTLSAGGYTGGVVGKAYADSPNGRIAFEKNLVGANPLDLSDTALRINVIGEGSVGLVAGGSTGTDYREGNHIFGSASGATDVGGVVGLADSNTSISDTKVDFIFDPSNAAGTKNNIGGVVGKVVDAAPVYIDGVISTFSIADSSEVVDSLGGIVGENNSGGPSNLHIKNSKAILDIDVDGQYHGGIIGNFQPSSNNASGEMTISSSVVEGHLREFSSSAGIAGTGYKGAIAGKAQHLHVQRIVAKDFNISGLSFLGGAIGYASGETTLEEIDLDIIIEGHENSADAQYVAGLVGSSQIDTGPEKYKNIKIVGEIRLDRDAINCSNNNQCGVIVGANQNAATDGIKNIIYAVGFLKNYAITQVDSIIIPDVGGTINTGVIAVTPNTDQANCDILNGAAEPFVFEDADCHPLFSKRWIDFGLDENSNLLAGNRLEPFPINNSGNWNAIGDDSLLMGKSFVLTSDINFSGGFTPLASSASPFTGSLIANGKKLIAISASDYAIAVTGSGARIGEHKDRLQVTDFDLTCASNNCGFVGAAEGGDFSVVLKDVNISETAAVSYVGGLIGIIRDQGSGAEVRIENSGFEGYINTPGSSCVGGLVGFVQYSASQINVSISDSFSRALAITAFDFVGGIVGKHESAESLSLENILVQINENGAATDVFGNLNVGGFSAGFIGGLDFSSNVYNSIIDYSSASVSTEFVSVISSGTVSGGNIHEIFSATSGDIADGSTTVGHTSYLERPAFIDSGDVDFGSDEDFKLIGGKVRLAWE